MNDMMIERTEARAEKSTVWRLSNKINGHFLDVVFDKNLENQMKRKRNFSFNRFESEQLNELHKLVEQIKDNYSLVLDQNVIGLDYLPLTAANAQSLLAKED
ncbi:MAG: hypothetical protein ABF483_06990 [Liquorilactobacillus nagelii]|jgi:N-acetyl-anhydromuramyl-L-alanine amidase AmpD|uniref:Uncharacterized protein n=1 Tax=Liquorilactobacillus nagelii TaxID=82688 RepID=A0A3S6QXE5_9LACO|nr:hypothetical protein [Liquorilactobacillus nagelii]AUJ32688.1 hypothetical protein BSQ50_09175 [Liquorilactobacillus nagelii]MCC7616902.1 hypothetical protein [Liquorilactobacillus nagelii]MCI1634143.1 hypothetical protein [Liquorilactobacillus nagelii]MCI1700795.1 hypothetical protein [Liquorilactobacillus nagelii]MCI1921419.1 hypothetical protein [Liquorilactobacillus nagelii]